MPSGTLKSTPGPPFHSSPNSTQETVWKKTEKVPAEVDRRKESVLVQRDVSASLCEQACGSTVDKEPLAEQGDAQKNKKNTEVGRSRVGTCARVGADGRLAVQNVRFGPDGRANAEAATAEECHISSSRGSQGCEIGITFSGKASSAASTVWSPWLRPGSLAQSEVFAQSQFQQQ